MTAIQVSGPYFEDLRVGYVERRAPAITLTEGHAALHQAILGGRLRLALDAPLAYRVLGAERPLAHPALVCDTAIGQSTLLTQRVIANLFYRGLRLHRAPLIGDTLHTATEVVALKQNRPRPDRAATGLAVLRIHTVDQQERLVLDFTRCAMLPLRDPAAVTGHADDIHAGTPDLDPALLAEAIAGWDLAPLRSQGPAFADFREGTTWEIDGGDVVSSAPELARLTTNVALAHHDRAAGQGGRRLVYGGHTIGLAAAQLTRALPDLAFILAWHSCDHLAPVFEDDVLTSTVHLEQRTPLSDSGGLLHLRSQVSARRADGTSADVLDWRLIAAHA
ncbi:MaoC family dehydratase [Solirubrobacter ginsenosidimutans]|uniref:MaoC family dehydratase n=1 Tax=Solirubrobacter ginsenosidimutans TaxID=490573 RepID=A0A9X3MSS1_9ACTN|nr:MaoC family dehydratase [Solirubrobacter ginsenosidimutans]MDA0158993.1 MaoC family dehydratase [Solirubrobacter ginsenosidimutans]